MLFNLQVTVQTGNPVFAKTMLPIRWCALEATRV